MKNGKLYNKSATNNHPDKHISVLHLAANINGDKYLEHVGYNLENNKVNPPGKYKIKQVNTLESLEYIPSIKKPLEENEINEEDIEEKKQDSGAAQTTLF